MRPGRSAVRGSRLGSRAMSAFSTVGPQRAASILIRQFRRRLLDETHTPETCSVDGTRLPADDRFPHRRRHRKAIARRLQISRAFSVAIADFVSVVVDVAEVEAQVVTRAEALARLSLDQAQRHPSRRTASASVAHGHPRHLHHASVAAASRIAVADLAQLRFRDPIPRPYPRRSYGPAYAAPDHDGQMIAFTAGSSRRPLLHWRRLVATRCCAVTAGGVRLLRRSRARRVRHARRRALAVRRRRRRT